MAKVYVIKKVKPKKNRLDSFWYKGYVATITDKRGNNVDIFAQGAVKVKFSWSTEDMDHNEAIKEALKHKIIDSTLDDNVDDWSNYNWFEFATKKRGEKDTNWSYYPVAHDYNDAIKKAKYILKQLTDKK